MDIDLGLLPLARGNMTVEQNIDLAVRPILHLRQPDVRHGEADKRGAGPYVAALAAEVGLVRVEHVAGEEDAGDVDGVIAATSDAGCEGSETDGRCFADDDPGGGGGAEAEEDGDDEAERCLGQRRGIRPADRGGDAENDQEAAIEG